MYIQKENTEIEKCVIIISTHSSYIDVCKNFIDLLKKNWSDCPYRIVLSVIGEKSTIDEVESVYIPHSTLLTDCIVQVAHMYQAKYYACFLGDAFIAKKIYSKNIEILLDTLESDKIEYCNISVVERKRNNREQKLYKFIKNTDVYSHSFVSFIATKNFIMSELKGISDIKFEERYLRIANEACEECYYSDRTRLIQDCFHIMPGIVKGKWDRFVYAELKNKNTDIELADRDKVSMITEIKIFIINKLYRYVPARCRKKIKKILGCFGLRFATKY